MQHRDIFANLKIAPDPPPLYSCFGLGGMEGQFVGLRFVFLPAKSYVRFTASSQI